VDEVDDGDDQVGNQNEEENEVEWRIETGMVLETLRGRLTHA